MRPHTEQGNTFLYLNSILLGEEGVLTMPQQAQRDIAYCPNCGNDSPQEFIASYSRYRPEHGFSHYTLVFCLTCQAPLLYHSDPKRTAATRGLALKDKELLWPQAKSLHYSVPERIRLVYEEAVRVKQRAPNAFANQIRRSLEAL
jgi:hypothetical protein